MQLRAAGLSANYNESIGHAIHSMTVQGLQLFNPRASEDNTIPTVNHNLHAKDGVKVLMYAPNDPLPSDYFGFTMNMIDKVCLIFTLRNRLCMIFFVLDPCYDR